MLLSLWENLVTLYLLISFCYTYCFPLLNGQCTVWTKIPFIILSFVKQKNFPMDLWLCKLIREQYKCFVIFSPLYAYLWTFQELPYQKLWAFFKCYGIHTSFMLYIWFFQFISLSVFDLNFCMKFGNSCSMLPSKSVAHWPSARLWFD